jgi:hypothetical protein
MMFPNFCGKMVRWQIGALLATRKRRRLCAEIDQTGEENI